MICFSCICLCMCMNINGQDNRLKDSLRAAVALDEIVVSGNRFGEKKKHIIQRIDVIGAGQIASMNAQNTGDLLSGSGKVFVQKSQQGGSSPVIRGFEASRILLVVDGVRLNNAIYRSGHLQNVITVDQHMLERVEITGGPASTLYGSDALGGSIQMYTRQVKLADQEKDRIRQAGAFIRYGSANREKTTHIDWNLANNRLGWLGSLTFSDFGDMRMGARYRKGFEGFGSRVQYVNTLNSPLLDTIIRNNNDRIQRFSGYQQWDLLQKVLYKSSDRVSHQLNVQLSGSSDVPRYDRLQDQRNNNLRFAVWSYGPQRRMLSAYSLNIKKPFFLADAFRMTLSWQDIEESRQTREYRRFDRFDSRRESVRVLGVLAELSKVKGPHTFTAGYDAQWNRLRSVADRTNLMTGVKTPLDTRYPDGRNIMGQHGIFIQHVYKSPDGQWVLNDGVRLQDGFLHARIIDNSFFNLPVTRFRQRQPAVTGNIGFAFMPNERNRTSIGWSTGFRAPNIDDLAKIFESSTTSRQLIIPNAKIRPEQTWSIELNHSFRLGSRFMLEAGIYHTWFRNAITLAPTKLNGQDSVSYNGVMCRVFSSQNVNQATIIGGYAQVELKLLPGLRLESSLNVTNGRMKTDPNSFTNIYRRQPDGKYELTRQQVSQKPLDHIPPLYGRTGLKYEQGQWNLEVFSLYNGWKRLDQFNPDGEDNAQYATSQGSPSWCTVNFRSSIRLHKQFQVQTGIENFFDQNYRLFASGFSSAGRHLYLTIKYAM